MKCTNFNYHSHMTYHSESAYEAIDGTGIMYTDNEYLTQQEDNEKTSY